MLVAWINAILVNKARTWAVRDGRMVRFSDLPRAESGGNAFQPERFLPDGHWAKRITAWDAMILNRQTSDRQMLARVVEYELVALFADEARGRASTD